jgi:retron-type reverse transcriptase
MKRYGNLYEKIYDMDNIRLAHKNARRGKRHYAEVKKVDENPEYYFKRIHEMLKNKTFENSKYHVFKKTFNKKEREIFKLPYFPDRIVHHCIMQILEPIWKTVLIRDTYSSLKGRGVHDGLRRVRKAMKNPISTLYCLKFDVKKFYPSIPHDILKTIIEKKIKCRDTLQLLYKIIDSASGVPIGNYLSQYLGNLYLTYFDHWMKEVKRCRFYFRYCDDIVVLSRSKVFLHDLAFRSFLYLKNVLNLNVKHNWQVFLTEARGIDFLGYRIFHKFCLLRQSIALSFKRKMKSSVNINSIMSYLGWLQHANTRTLIYKYATGGI